ncbi:RNA polymerase sigma factor [Mesobacillus subterraneus]|uniref:RNA polymerase sigma factor n=1 Tax=Mesobacillus subterraneus TaxID=285983 RepID=UPI001CFC8840|nr:RNA polymerase sigma factor [Mesobacillus subterraneus]WLR53739.1 RNA polymerase sigma factor [Mesobacillus subterraneus]
MSDHYSIRFQEVYEEYSDKVYGYLLLLTGKKEVAEDLTQETFLRVYKHIHQFNGDSQIFTWIVKIARNVAIDHLRRRRRLRFFSLDKYVIESCQPSPVEIIVKGEKTSLLYKGIKALKLNYQEVLILRKIKEFSIKETAVILGWSESKVKITTSRAMAALKKELKRRGDIIEEII